ncbi:MAG: DL-endopeptidase inhibitor IseA family protein [Anaerotignum sp.]
MKKKFVVLMTCALMGASVLAGCGGNSAEAPTQSPVEEAIVVEDGSLPPLDEDLQELYAGAYKIYNQISFGNFDCDAETTMEKDGFEYYKITDSRFETYDAFREYLEQYFTKDFVANGILGEGNIMFAKGEDGGLYFLGGGRGMNIFYAGHTFRLDEETDSEINFTATAYYTNSNEAYDGDYFYTAPETPEDYTTQDFHFTLLKEDGAWKFNDFALFF